MAAAAAVTVAFMLVMAMAFAFMLVVAMAFAVMVVVAVVATTVAAATATLAAHHVEHALYLFCRGLACRDYFAAKVQGLAGKGMVEVYRHCAFLHLGHEALKTVAVGIDQGQHGTGIYALFIETAVNAEHAFVEFHHVLLHVRAVSLLNRNREVKLVAGGEAAHFFLKGIERKAHAGDELEGVVFRGFLYKFVNAFGVVGKKFVCHGDILVL